MDLKKYNLLFTFFYAGTLTALVSLTLTLMNAGIENFYFANWVKSWFIAFAIVFVCSFFLPSMVRKLLNKIITTKDNNLN